MSSIVPPLDYIPKLPGIGVNLIVNQLDKQIDKLVDNIGKLLQKVIGLPDDIDCNDDRVKDIKKLIDKIIKLIENIQKALAELQKIINTIKQIVQVAKTVKATISAAQLLNPVTAPLFIANQLMLIQDATIVNAIEALKQFQTIPSTTLNKISALIPQLLGAVGAINSICSGTETPTVVPLSTDLTGGTGGGGGGGTTSGDLPITVNVYVNGQLIKKYSIIQTSKQPDGYWLLRVVEIDTYINAVKDLNFGDIVELQCPAGQKFKAKVIDISSILNDSVFCLKTLDKLQSICSDNLGDIDFNSLVETEFYTELNVSDEDLEFRSDTIEDLLKQQQDLLKSLLEAPSKVYQGNGKPNNAIGKIGDYYVDLNNDQVYGPKLSINSWI